MPDEKRIKHYARLSASSVRHPVYIIPDKGSAIAPSYEKLSQLLSERWLPAAMPFGSTSLVVKFFDEQLEEGFKKLLEVLPLCGYKPLAVAIRRT